MARPSRLKLLQIAMKNLGRIACMVEALGAKAFLTGGAAEHRLTVDSGIDVVVLIGRSPGFEEAVAMRSRLLSRLEEEGIPLYLPIEFYIIGPDEAKRYRRLIPLECSGS